MKQKKPSLIITGTLILSLGFMILALAPVWKRRGSGNLTSLLPAIAQAAEVNPWISAVEKVKEDRGEPVGKQATVETPSQLRHYSDTRRFLATQVAEVKEHHVETPQDLVDLAVMINRGELVQLRPVTESYILFGVGGNADKRPFTRYEDGKSISLYNEAELRQEYERLAEAQGNAVREIGTLKEELGKLKRRERSRRVKLQTQITAAEMALKLDRENKTTLDRYYGNAARRQQLFADYESLQKLGSKSAGDAFDLADADARRQMKVALLSSLRPEALRVLENVAASYHAKFNRPLPVTSLVRPDEYQMELSKTNANATRIETPPHSTGLAFDILYRYMTAAEQLHVMSELARLKDEGRIEVLRENRDHYHVFAFVDGARPREEFISASLGEARPAKVARSGKTKVIESRTAKVARRRTANAARESHHSQGKSGAAKRKVKNPRSARH